MHSSPARWTRAVATAALLMLPLTAAAHPQDKRVDAAAAKQHLSEARDTLSQLTSMPEAARLQGDARNQVSQLISNFNDLITTQSDWRSAYAKVDANLAALLGPDNPDQPPPTGVTGAVGTSGAAQLDPAVRTKLVELRTHLKEFVRAADGSGAGAMAPGVATGVTANPANPANPAPAGAKGTSGVMPPSPTATMPAADQARAADQVGHVDVDRHLDAISAILNKSKTGTLTRAQTAALKKHVAELRQLLQQGR
jgi:hypothetical protein